MQGMIPPNIDYSKSVSDGYQKKTYKKGETCIKYNKLYQAEEDIDEPEEWNPEHWKETTVEQIRAQVQQEIEAVNKKIANITPDDTAVDGKPWTSKHIVDMLCPPLKVSGNPVQCYPVAGYPLGITASWEPTQEGTGDPSPDNIRPIKGRDSVAVTRCGANILDPADFENSKTVNGITFSKSDNGSVKIEGNASKTSYYNICKSFPAIITISKDGSYVSGDYIISVSGLTDGVTVVRPSDKSVIYIRVVTGSTVNTTVYIQIEIGSVATEYTPYIGDTITLTLPETIYGGSADAVSGQGQKKWESIAISNIKEGGTFTYGGQLCYRVKIRNCQKIICNKLKSLVNWKSPMSDYSIELQNPNYLNVVIYVPGLTTEAEYKAWIAENEPFLLYKFVNEIPFEASGAKNIKALSGVNTVLTDADTADVTGREDLIHAITGQ